MELRAHFRGGTGPFRAALLDEAEGLAKELLASEYAPVLLAWRRTSRQHFLCL